MFHRSFLVFPSFFLTAFIVLLEALIIPANSLEDVSLEILATGAGECWEDEAQAPIECLLYGAELLKWSEERGIDPILVRAVAMAESSMRSDAVRLEPRLKDASYGLMQILYSTAQEVGYSGEPQGLLNAGVNLEFGTAYLKKMLDQFGEVRLALAAYNAGPTRVSRLVKRHGASYDRIRSYLPRSTRAYVQRVLDWYHHFDAVERSGT